MDGGCFTRMSPFVNLQIGSIGVLDITTLTAKSHLDPSMEFGVLFQDCIGDKALATDIAKPRFVTRMSQQMSLKMNLLYEAFVTIFAYVWPFACMNLRMLSQS